MAKRAKGPQAPASLAPTAPDTVALMERLDTLAQTAEMTRTLADRLEARLHRLPGAQGEMEALPANTTAEEFVHDAQVEVTAARETLMRTLEFVGEAPEPKA